MAELSVLHIPITDIIIFGLQSSKWQQPFWDLKSVSAETDFQR
jgi:hypothetical protein